MRNAGYLRTPAVNDATVLFVTEDDLWSVPLGGGTARRLTAGLGPVGRAAFSPDGRTIAFTSLEETHPEVFVMPATGGQARRVTFLGANSAAVAWSPRGDIVFRTDHAQPFMMRRPELYSVSAGGGIPQPLGLGWAHEISYASNGGVVLGRNTLDPASWKRYRGGRVGRMWIDARGKGTFKPLVHDLGGNVGSPMFVGKRVYFLSDHEGIGNLYSCTPDGRDVRRHTDHGEYYARWASTDGRTIVYQHAAEIWALDVATDVARRVEIDLPSPRTQRNRKFVSATGYMQAYALHPEGHSLAIETRGKMFTMPLWDGGVREYGVPTGVRYRRPQWLPDGKRLLCLSDESGETRIEIYGADGTRLERFEKLDIGVVNDIVVNPKRDLVAIANERLDLLVVDLATGKANRVDRNEYGFFSDLVWSADGSWLAYSAAQTQRTRGIKLLDAATNRSRFVTLPSFRDWAPAFDPEGRYLYFLSDRTFDPVPDEMFFELSFPRATRPYLIALRADAKPPFLGEPKGLGDKDAGKDGDKDGDKDGKKSEAKNKKDERLAIDFDGIADRIVAFPVPDKRYSHIEAIKNKVFFTSHQILGMLGESPDPAAEEPGGTLEVYDLEQQKHEVLISGVSGFTIARDGATMVYHDAQRRLRAVKAGERPDAQLEHDPPSRRSGWIDLGRVRVSVDPGAEWRQMYSEAWRLQRDAFWTKDMSGVDWKRVHARYLPLTEKIATRLEFSDLIWEMQGELGTSHAYEMGGDHRRPPQMQTGQLAADFAWDKKSGGYRITHIVRGDAWDASRTSPLAVVGAGVREGDTLLAVNGRRVSADIPPQALLVNHAGQLVELTVGDRAGANTRTITVRALHEEWTARYREWVERNRAHVHEASNGRVGYVHIPNMGAVGYSEFHRYYFSELDREGLVVDVRFNGGGNVSSLILEKLARERLGYDVKRWGPPEPYPQESVFGPMVCLTNESAGSDGDIFTHCFKLMKLGPVVGTRTWGGVVGIWMRHPLADNGATSQPEFSFWFKDVGWGVENYGTDPDHWVDITPQDYAAGKDPQMDKALALITADLKRDPPKLPDFSKRPSLKLPTLPKRR